MKALCETSKYSAPVSGTAGEMCGGLSVTGVELGTSSAGEAGTVNKAGNDVHAGADGWFVGKFRMGGVGVDCDSTSGGSGDESLAIGRVNEACEGAD